MQKTDVNTALAIFFLATAVMLIGGLAVVPAFEQQQAYAAEDDDVSKVYCFKTYREGTGELVSTSCDFSKKFCQEAAQRTDDHPDFVANPDECNTQTDSQCPDSPCITKETRKRIKDNRKD